MEVLESLRSDNPDAVAEAAIALRKKAKREVLTIDERKALVALRADGRLGAREYSSEKEKIRDLALNALHEDAEGGGKEGTLKVIAETAHASADAIQRQLMAVAGRTDMLFVSHGQLHEVARRNNVDLTAHYGKQYPEKDVLEPMLDLLKDTDERYRRYGAAYFWHLAGKMRLGQILDRLAPNLIEETAGLGVEPDFETERLIGMSFRNAAEIEEIPQKSLQQLVQAHSDGKNSYAQNEATAALMKASVRQPLPDRMFERYASMLQEDDPRKRGWGMSQLASYSGNQRFNAFVLTQLAFALNDNHYDTLEPEVKKFTIDSRVLAVEALENQAKIQPGHVGTILADVAAHWESGGQHKPARLAGGILAGIPETLTTDALRSGTPSVMTPKGGEQQIIRRREGK